MNEQLLEIELLTRLASARHNIFNRLAPHFHNWAGMPVYDGMRAAIALLPDDGSSTSFDRSSINETFKKPFDAALLAERLRTLIGAKKELV